jgi:hypothetical protein
MLLYLKGVFTGAVRVWHIYVKASNKWGMCWSAKICLGFGMYAKVMQVHLLCLKALAF